MLGGYWHELVQIQAEIEELRISSFLKTWELWLSSFFSDANSVCEQRAGVSVEIFRPRKDSYAIKVNGGIRLYT